MLKIKMVLLKAAAAAWLCCWVPSSDVERSFTQNDDSTEEPIRTTRSSERGDLPTTIPKTGFRHQSSRLWNSLSDKTLPKKLLGNYPL
jgi:hypothetical protein